MSASPARRRPRRRVDARLRARVAALLPVLVLGGTLSACVAGDSARHLSESQRADAAAYLDEQLVDGVWELGRHSIRVDASGWAFERARDGAQMVTLALAVGLGALFGLAWAQSDRGRSRIQQAARGTAPLVGSCLLAWLLSGSSTTVIDLDAGIARHQTTYLGGVGRGETVPLKQLGCRVRSNRQDNADGSSSDFAFLVTLERPAGSGGTWTLVETSDEALAHAVCARLQASFGR